MPPNYRQIIRSHFAVVARPLHTVGVPGAAAILFDTSDEPLDPSGIGVIPNRDLSCLKLVPIDA